MATIYLLLFTINVNKGRLSVATSDWMLARRVWSCASGVESTRGMNYISLKGRAERACCLVTAPLLLCRISSGYLLKSISW